ncbi:c-type cytochrome [Deinococcus aerophilus]|uniref:Cytochrome-like protein n=1 Tax=Deinococcus aerophilus TaxID=522488 RepID=A0ABQ2GSD9_9DEIO|nr:c-type cytochrome [Deinococcus aerophilus]GGM09755.1 cytochrome-like protein [Deinococcus aerophilus]
MNRTRHNPWVEGSLASWMAGVTLGVILGIALLIVTPRLMGGSGSTAEAPTAQEQATDSAPSGSAETAPAASEGTPETATTNAPTDQTPAAEQTSSGELPAAQSPAVADTTTGNPPQQDPNAVAEPVAAGGTGDAAPTPNAAAGNAEAGATVFTSNCAGCHGAQGGGGIGPSLVTDEGPKAWTLAQFTTVLREGVLPGGRELSAVMPRFSDAQLSDTQVADLLAHIQTLN